MLARWFSRAPITPELPVEPPIAGWLVPCPTCRRVRALRANLMPTTDGFAVRCRGCRSLIETTRAGCRAVESLDGARRSAATPRRRRRQPRGPEHAAARHVAGRRQWAIQLGLLLLIVLIGVAVASRRRRTAGTITTWVGPAWLVASTLAWWAWRERAAWARRMAISIASLQIGAALLALTAGVVSAVGGSELAARYELTDFLFHPRRGLAAVQALLALPLLVTSIQLLRNLPPAGDALTWTPQRRAVAVGSLVALAVAGLLLISSAWRGTFDPSRALRLGYTPALVLALAGALTVSASALLIPKPRYRTVAIGLLVAGLVTLGWFWSGARAERVDDAQRAQAVLDTLDAQCPELRVRSVKRLRHGRAEALRTLIAPAVTSYDTNDTVRRAADRWLFHYRRDRLRRGRAPEADDYQHVNYCHPDFRRSLKHRIQRTLN